MISERGYEGLTVRGISKRAGVSTRTFYSHFGNLDECLGMSCDAATRRLFERMTKSCNTYSDREERCRDAVDFLLRSAARQPDGARMILLEAASGGPAAQAQSHAATATCSRLLFDLFPALTLGTEGSRRLAVGMAAGMIRILRRTLIAERAGDLPDVAAELSDWLLAVSRLRTIEHRPMSGGASRQAIRREPDPFPDRRDTILQPAILDDRSTLLRAAASIAATGGVAGLTVAGIRSKTGISNRNFNRYFTGPRECLLEAVEWIATSASAKARAWADATPRGPQRTQYLLLALCAQAARSQSLAKLVLLQIPECGREGLLREDQLVTHASVCLEAEILASPAPRQTVATEASAAALWQIASEEVAAGRARQLPRLAPALADLACASSRAAATR
jgi:AcrR family transcriptional regulator